MLNIGLRADSGEGLAQAAVGYARRGWAVLPCHRAERGHCSCGRPRCHSPGKHPRLPDGFHGASDDAGQVAAWWGLWPDANVAIVPGRSHCPDGCTLLVLDLDGPRGRESAVELGIPADTASAATGRPDGGEHRYFRVPAGLEIGNRSPAPGLDVRHMAGYVLAPPSVHPSGAVYRWHGAPAWRMGAARPLPEHVLALLTDPPPPPASEAGHWGPTFHAGPSADARTWRRAAAYLARVPSGLADERKQTAYRLAAALLHDIGLPERDALDLLGAWNADNRPPLGGAVLERIFQNAARYGRNRGAA